MNIHEYVGQKKELYNYLMTFIENDDVNPDDFQNLVQIIEKLHLKNDPVEFKAFIHLLSKITKNHQSCQRFFERIEKVFDLLKTDIKQTFSDSEIFHMFKNNKRILLLLFQKQVLIPDDTIINFIKTKTDKNDSKFRHYFYPEIKPYISGDLIRMIEEELNKLDNNYSSTFEEKRLKGENDSYVCELIRNDSVKDFISYLSRTNLSINQFRVTPSLFETNPYLIKTNPSLIEYAAFFGSIKIFQYLKINGSKMTFSLWDYAIHGKNSEIINILEEDKDMKISYMHCFNESIKSHHNEIANYFLNNFIDEKEFEKQNKTNYSENYIENIFHYYNYEFFPDEFTNPFIFDYLCKYNYVKIVKFLLQSKSILNINQRNGILNIHNF